MTDRPEIVEPPLARRHVQLTVGVFAFVALCWLLIESWSLPAREHPFPSDDGGTVGRETIPLIQIDLNIAPRRELALLPGVGPVLAKRIADNRRRLGPFRSVDDLQRVHGIGPKKLAEIRHLCVVDAPSPTGKSGERLASAYDSGDPD